MKRGKLYLGCLLVLGLIYGLPVRFGIVLGESMAPTLHTGQLYLLDRGHYRLHSPSRNDVVVFKRNGVRYVKRIAAVEGDQILVNRNLDLSKDEVIFSNEVKLLNALSQKWPHFRSVKPIARRVPAGYFYVLGDHLSCSEDSRELGFISREEIEGRVLFTTPTSQTSKRLALVPGPVSL